jgi:hypothetical protein
MGMVRFAQFPDGHRTDQRRAGSVVFCGRLRPATAGRPPPPVSGTVTAMGAHIAATGAMDLEVHGAPSGLAVLSFGQAAAMPGPLWGDTYFLDATTVTVFDVVLLDAAGAGSWQTMLPASVPSGLSLWLQSVVIDAAGTFRMTTPSVVTTP